MNKDNMLFGQLNQEIELLEYTGKKTDTANVTVDGKEQTIAVDVLKLPHTLTIKESKENRTNIVGHTFDGSRDVEVDLTGYATDEETQEKLDAKRDKIVRSGTQDPQYTLVYSQNTNGAESSIPTTTSAVAGSIPIRNSNGNLVGVNAQGSEYTPFSQVDAIAKTKVTKITVESGKPTRVYGVNSSGETSIPVDKSALANAIAWRNANANLIGNDATANNEYTPLAQVEQFLDKKANVIPKPDAGTLLYGISANSQTDQPFGVQASTYRMDKFEVVQRDTDGQINLPNQSTLVPSDNQAIGKAYADDRYLGQSGGTITGDVTIQKTLTVNDAITAKKQINIPNQITDVPTDDQAIGKRFADNRYLQKTGDTVSGNLAITGNLTVSGTTTTEREEQLLVKANVIATNADKTDLQTLLSGLAINKNADATYGIMYDPTDDTVKFGEGTLSADNKFVFSDGEGHPLAIREDSAKFVDAHLVKWDAATNSFIDAGIAVADLSAATNIENGSGINALKQKPDGETFSGLKDGLNAESDLTKNDDTVIAEFSTDAAGQNSTILGGKNRAMAKRATTIGGYNVANGASSLATGEQTRTDGRGAFSAGQRTLAKGGSSVATGGYSKAIGDFSFTQGYATTAEGRSSMSTGAGTKAKGDSSFAGGSGAQAIGNSSFATGDSTIAQGVNAFATGVNTQANGDNSAVFGDSSVAGASSAFVTGRHNISNNTKYVAPIPGGGGGTVEPQPPSDFNVEEHYGEGASITGAYNSAYGFASSASGLKTSARGHYSTTEGVSTIASGEGSHAQGGNTEASGKYSSAEGIGTKAQGENSHAEGASTIASGYNAHTQGEATQATEVNAFATGQRAIASGKNSVAEGEDTAASGTNSHASGQSTLASGTNSFASGNTSKATGIASFATGTDTTANGQNSFAGGNGTQANNTNAVALGSGTIASGVNSTALGLNTKAEGQNSFANGNGSQAKGINAFANGSNTFARRDHQTALGLYVDSGANSAVGGLFIGHNNNPKENALFQIGNGGSSGRSNAMTVFDDGTSEFENTISIKQGIDKFNADGEKEGSVAIRYIVSDANPFGTMETEHEYFIGDADAIEWVFPETGLADGFYSVLHFVSGAEATTNLLDEGSIQTGDDCKNGVFTPKANMSYTVVCWYDGLKKRCSVSGIPTNGQWEEEKSGVLIGSATTSTDLKKIIYTANSDIPTTPESGVEYAVTDLIGEEDIDNALSTKINNKQDKLTFDTTPTSGSTNPVTSDGIYKAIADFLTIQVSDSLVG